MRWFTLVFLLSACFSPHDKGTDADAAAEPTNPSGGLFGGSGNGAVSLAGEDASATVAAGDGAVAGDGATVGATDGGMESEVDGAVEPEADAGADAGEDAGAAVDAGPVEPQCQPCGPSTMFPTCPAGYFCIDPGGSDGQRCLQSPDTQGKCPEGLTSFLGAPCEPSGLTCDQWSEMYGH